MVGDVKQFPGPVGQRFQDIIIDDHTGASIDPFH